MHQNNFSTLWNLSPQSDIASKFDDGECDALWMVQFGYRLIILCFFEKDTPKET